MQCRKQAFKGSVIAFLTALIQPVASAAIYHIDSQNGSDSWSGIPSAAQPSGVDGPWQSFSRLTTIQLRPGDSVLLKCGSKWSQTLKLNNSGSATAPIKIATYPQPCDNRPEITGLTTIPEYAWEIHSGSIYKSPITWNHIKNSQFSQNSTGWSIWSPGSDARLTTAPDCSEIHLHCATATSGATGPNNTVVSSSQFNIEGAKKYTISYMVNAPRGVPIRAYVRRGGPTYEIVGYRKEILGTGTWQKISEEFIGSKNLSNARFDIEISPGRHSVSLTSISLQLASQLRPAKLLVASGATLPLAHHPNLAMKGSIYARTPSPSDSALIGGSPRSTYIMAGNDLSLPAGVSLTSGINAIVRSSPWSIDERRVTSVVDKKMTLDTPTTYPIPQDRGYYLTGALWMLDEPGEWFSDQQGSYVYVWMPDSNRPGSRVATSNLDLGVDLSQISNIEVSGIKISGTETGINIQRSTNISINDIEISNTSTNGITGNGAALAKVFNSKISKSGNDAIYLPNSTFAEISGCQISESAVQLEGETIASLPRTSFAAIFTGKNSHISNNKISKTGYIGIRAFDDSVIEKNVVLETCQTLNDCGGIYISGFSPRTEVRDNIIRKAPGNIDGLPMNWQHHGVGIYMDDHSNGSFITNNTIADAVYGIHIHDSYNNTITNNKIFGNKSHQIWLQEQRTKVSTLGDIFNNEISENEFFPLDGNIQIMQESTIGPINRFGSYEKNRFSALVSTNLVGEKWPAGSKSLTLQQWQTEVNDFGQLKGDSHATEIRPDGYAALHIAGESIIPNGNLSNGTSGWSSWSSASPTPRISKEACDAISCIKIVTGGGFSALTSPKFSVVREQSYRVSFDMKASVEQGSISVVVRRGGPTPLYESLMAAPLTFPLSNKEKRYSFTFTATKTINANDPITGDFGARIDFEKISTGVEVFIGNVEITPIRSTKTTLKSHLISNEESQTQIFDCPDSTDVSPQGCESYFDFSTGEIIYWPITLAPLESRIIFNKDLSAIDSDRDGISDIQDECPQTQSDDVVNSRGCGILQNKN